MKTFTNTLFMFQVLFYQYIVYTLPGMHYNIIMRGWMKDYNMN